jgi:adenosylcobinamide-phosphate synthase
VLGARGDGLPRLRGPGRTAAGLAGALAVGLDLGLREPPAGIHPVRAVGRYLECVARWVPADPPVPAVVSGGAAWAVGAVLSLATGVGCEAVAWRLPRPLRVVARGAALWPLLSVRMLYEEVAAVETALAGNLGAGRAAVARIVSRDTADLPAEQVRAAALESLAENLSDSLVAPLLWYAVGGLPAAAAYRFANTADACWGYRSPRWRYAGQVAARADDALNLAPARATAAVLLIGAGPGAGRRTAAEAHRTPSPNAGWPMAALAVRLGRRLGKPGAYDLNAAAPAPRPEDVAVALGLARRVVALAVLLAAAVEYACRR